MCATGVCHSDVSVINGTVPLRLPTVSGHAGSGVAEQVGKGLTNVKPGDHVVLSFVPTCGSCFHCLRGETHFRSLGIPTGVMLDGTAARSDSRQYR